MDTTDAGYPVRFDIDHPEEPRNRLTVAFRLILVIPILAVIAAIGAAGSSSGDPTSFMCIAAGVLFLPSLMLIVARQKYPRWWFDFSVAYLSFHNRVVAYLLLLRDEYPSTDEDQSVHFAGAVPRRPPRPRCIASWSGYWRARHRWCRSSRPASRIRGCSGLAACPPTASHRSRWSRRT